MADTTPPNGEELHSLPPSQREQVGWYFYDWANSAFTTTVITVFLGPYLTSITRAAADAEGFVYPLGIPVSAGAFYPYLIALSVMMQIVVLPILGAISDYSRLKKQMLLGSAYIGACATMSMYFVQGTNYLLGGGLFLIANLAFGASIVFYNAFLGDIAKPEQRDQVSSRGWAMGYLGGGLLLLANLLLFNQRDALGLATEQAVRISLFSAGLWWAFFSLIPMRTLRTRHANRHLPAGTNVVTIGFVQIRHTLSQVRNYPQTLLFLVAYLLYNDGIQAVIALSAQFGSEELGLDETALISAVLLTQFVAFLGALGFGYLARFTGAKRAIIGSLMIWTGTLIYAFAFLRTGWQFFLMAAVIALVLGGTQALSRSVFSLMIPRGQEAEYFSLYEVSERGTSWLAPLLFGLALQFTGSYRISIVSMILFFLSGLLLLWRVDVRRAIEEAGNVAPARV